MRKLIAALLVGSALWSGYWYVGKTAKFNVLESWFSDRRDDGWTAKYTDFRVVGFPNRFDSRFEGLDLRSPHAGIGWQAPKFHILALSYKPNHIIAVFDDTQTLSLPLEDVGVSSSEMMASVVFEPDTKLAVDRIQLQSMDLVLNGGLGWQAKAKHLSLSTRQNGEFSNAHDIAFDARSVTPTKAFRSHLDPKGRLPATIETLFLNMMLGFDAPWDRVAIEQGAPEVTKIDITRMKLAWGVLGLTASGALDVAPDGQISGRLALEIKNWREVLDLTVTSGLLDQGTADTIGRGLGLLTAGSDDPTSLSVPLVLADGAMALGPIPLGFAPRFVR